MAHQKKSWVTSGARFCASCLITLTCWAVWIFLGCTLAGLAYIALSRELPVPDFMLRRIESELAASGFELKFGRARLDPTGKVLLEDVRLRDRQFEDPLLVCRLLYVRRDFWSLLSAEPATMEIQLEGAALHLPAMLSNSGATEAIVDQLSARLHYDRRIWQVEQLICAIGGVRVSARGQLGAIEPRGADRTLVLGELSSRYLAAARKLLPYFDRLSAFDRPSLQIGLAPDRIDLQLTAGAVHQPWGWPVTTGPIVANTTVRLDRKTPQPVRVELTARTINYNNRATAGRLSARFAATVDIRGGAFRAADVDLAADSIGVFGETLVAPLVHADLSAWPTVRVATKLLLEQEYLAVTADAHLAEKRARIHAEGRVSSELISRNLSARTPRAAPYFVFGDPVWFVADADLAPGWKFSSVDTRVAAGRLDSRGVKVTAARGRIDIKGQDFLAHDAYAEIGANHARGSYWMNFATTDYRMLLDGQLRPAEISGWFKGEWWPTFWNRYFDFSKALPSASVDVQGRWRDPSLSQSFVVAQAGPASVWGGDFEHVDAKVFVRPGFAHGWDITATRAAGRQRIAGMFKRTVTPGVRDGSRFEFDFTGNPEPRLVGRMLEGRADDVLALVEVSEPPDIHAWGTLDGSETRYNFTGRALSPLHFLSFPIDQGSFSCVVEGTTVKMDQINFSAAGGTGRMRATLAGPLGERRLGFDLFGNGMKLNRAIHAFEEYEALSTGKPYAPSPDGKFVRKAGSSQLDFSLSAQGLPGDLQSFAGSGNASLTGAELGEVHLFGLLSQVLSGLTLSFSSLKLDAVRTSFQLRDGVAYFPDLKVTGPSAVIDGRGRYSYMARTLDFNAKFKPYDQPGSLLAAAVGLVMNPLTSILELRLTGTLANPKWSVDIAGPMSGSTAAASRLSPTTEKSSLPPP